ncbi:MAG: DoxX family protein [Bacteroidota bacterium]|nr:DoxX family protein [Bacteroidota bacterium]MDP4211903.1 DoxX family protein [Bacteroidota bacterium]MDP4248508.1 DoxX family protein [Bacteroidota bacterium]
MKKLLSTAYSDNAFNFAMLVQRVVTGLMLLIAHGLLKISNFSEMSGSFFDPLRIGHRNTLILSIFAEVFCSMLLVLGLFTRLAAFVIVLDLSFAVFMYHRGQPIKNMDLGVIYLTSVFSILLLGPGRVSVDGMMAK